MSVYVGVPKPETVTEITSVLTGVGELGALDVTGATLNGTPITPTDNPSYTFRTQGDTIKVTINVTIEITALSVRYGWDGTEEPWGGDPASLSFMLSKQDGVIFDIRGSNTIKTQNNWLAFIPVNPITVGTYIIEITLDSGVPDYFEGLTDLSIQAQYNKDGAGVARKVTKIYTGVDNVAKQVKKGYVGVGGVARPFFSAEARLEYYGAIDPLSEARYSLAATTVGDYALFGGGSSPSLSYSDTVDAYDTSLVRSTPTVLSVGRQQLAATTVGNYALFGGGSGTSAKKKDTVDAYDTTLVRSTPTVLSEARYSLAATTVGNHALFGSGYNGWDTVDAYDTTLVRITPTVLSETRYSLAATTVGDYALFGGGTEGLDTFKDTVDAYHVSLTRSTPTVLSVGRYLLTATTVGDYALFGGGNVELTTNKDTVDAYNSSLTRSTPTVLSVARYYLSATTVGNYALFGGGNGGDLFTMISKDTVDAYNSSLTRSTPTVLSLERFALNSTTIGDYALFGGGWGDEPKYKDTVDAYYQEGAQYVTLTFEFTNKDFGFNSGFPEGSDIYLCYQEDSSAVGAIDNKFSRVTNSMLEEQPPLTVRVKKGKTLCLGFRTSESDFGRLAYLKSDVIPWTNGSAGFLASWGQTFFSLNPKYPYNEFYCTASVVNSLAPIDPVYPDEGEDWS